MQPYKRKRRSRRDMFVLGGWLFADLLLGLAMLFAVANTVGQEPPTPTPTASPDLLATAESDLAIAQAENRQTVEALESQVNDEQVSAQQTQAAVDDVFAAATETAAAEATRSAMNEDERATADAQATEAAVSAQATIDALATEQAGANSDVASLNNQLATNVAQATEAAAAMNDLATEQAEIQAVATENADSGANADATAAAAQSALATSQADASNAQATSDAAAESVANAQATSDAASQAIDDAQATAAASGQQVEDAQATAAALEEQVQLNSLDPNAQTVTISVDANGLLAGDDDAVEDARAQIERALEPYVDGENCRIGFVNISSGAGSVGQGVQVSEQVAGIIESDFAELLPEATDGESPQLASNAIALTGSNSQGQVQLQLFLSSGCQPAG